MKDDYPLCTEPAGMKQDKRSSTSRRFQQWAVVAWPTHSGCDYQLLTGRYKTRAGANLAADCAAKIHQRTMMVVTVLRHNEDIV